jgi:hypothetical protein
MYCIAGCSAILLRDQNLTLLEGKDDFLIYLFKGILKNGGDVLKFAGIIIS